MKKTNNKGFSLVELIVVIAIMAVLIGVLAPTFTKYVEQARRSTDIQNAEEIRQAVLADIADGVITGSGAAVDPSTLNLTTMTTVPAVEGSLGGSFTVDYDAVNGTCSVSAAGFVLTDTTGAANYKAAGVGNAGGGNAGGGNAGGGN